MLFKSATGDLSNNEDCFLRSLNKNLWRNPKKIVYSSIAQSVVAAYINIPDTIHWFEETKSENFGGVSIALRAMSALGYQNDNLPRNRTDF